MIMANKIELMHRIFGKNEKYCCIECSHYKRKTYGSRTYRKCEVYGDGNSTGTDWKRLISRVVWRHISNIPEARSWNWPEPKSGQKMMIFPDR